MAHQPTYHPDSPDSEVTLADIILSIKAHINHLVQNWYWIFGAAFLAGILAWFILRSHTIHYTADITFVANEEKQQVGSSALASTLASFGMSSGKGDGTSIYSKIIALSKSRKIQFSALLDTVILDGNSDLLVNHISRIYQLTEEWKVEEPVHFTSLHPDRMDLIHKGYLKRIYNMMVGGDQPMFDISFDNASQMVTMKAETVDEELSMSLIESLYTNLDRFYIIQSTAKGNETVTQLTLRKDSLENVLHKQQARLASAIDRSRGMTYQTEQTNRLDLRVDLEITQAMYIELVKNLEMSRYNLETIRPVFTIIDYPLQPLGTDRKNPVYFIGIFVIIAGFMTAMGLILRKIYRDIMQGVEGGTNENHNNTSYYETE